MRVVSSETKRNLFFALWFLFKHTHTYLVSDAVLLGSDHSEARCTQRTFESGMKSMYVLFIQWNFTFLCKHETKAV